MTDAGPAPGGDWPRPVVHFEIGAADPDRLAPFYAALFSWPIGEGTIRFFPAGLGGPEPGPAGHLRQSERRGVTLYVQVRDLAFSLTRAVELGGTSRSSASTSPAARRWRRSRTPRATP